MASTSLTNTRATLAKIQDSAISGVAATTGVVADAPTLTVADSGRVIRLPVAVNAYQITLPDPGTPGLKFTFCAGATQTAIVTITANAKMVGMWRQVDGTGTPSAGANSIKFAATAVIGDRIEMVSDGFHYHVVGSTGVADGIAF